MNWQCELFIGPETLSLTSGGRKLSAFDDPHKNISSSHLSPINKLKFRENWTELGREGTVAGLVMIDWLDDRQRSS